MASLHLINKCADHPRFLACLAIVASEDMILLTENAVTALVESGISWPDDASVYALAEDIESRGLGPVSFAIAVERIDYTQFVALTLEADKVVSW